MLTRTINGLFGLFALVVLISPLQVVMAQRITWLISFNTIRARLSSPFFRAGQKMKTVLSICISAT